MARRAERDWSIRRLEKVDEASWSGTRQLLRADRAALTQRMHRFGPVAFPNYTAVVLYRLSRLARLNGRPLLARGIMRFNQWLTGAELNVMAVAGPGFALAHPIGVVFGAQVVAGSNLFLGAASVLGSDHLKRGMPTIGDDVTLYVRATVLGEVTLGDGAVVGAHAVVVRDVPAGHVARAPLAEVVPGGRSVVAAAIARGGQGPA